MKKVLKTIVANYPDVEFMTTDRLGQIIELDYDKK